MENKNRDEFKIIGLQIETSVQECKNDNKMPALWEEFIKRVPEISNRVGENFYGVSFKTGECEFRCIAAVEVSSLDELPEGMVGEIVPASKYLAFEHKGKLDKLNDTYGQIAEKEMPASGMKEKDVWLEVYDERFKLDSDDSIIEIWVSVE